MKLKIWFLETRPEFLVLSLILAFLGTSISQNAGFFNFSKFVLSTLGLLLAHISVNVFNDYFDFKSGIDLDTKPTAFSGGSGILPKGSLSPISIYIFALASLTIAFCIGLYFTITIGWQLIPLILIGGIAIYFYTTHFSKWIIGEFFAGLCLGSLPVLGIYFIQTGAYSFEAVFISIAPALLTANLLLLNEFPDLEADKKGGRYHLIIALGRKKAALLYTAVLILTYICIIIGALAGITPLMTLISLMTIPIACKAASRAIKHYDDMDKIIPAMKANVITVLATDALLAAGYLLA